MDDKTPKNMRGFLERVEANEKIKHNCEGIITIHNQEFFFERVYKNK
ncbi:MAG: hypothetical protein LBF97_01110 [Elusimicrobiota bacterium]|jgi:hypothetical protein|nr:hypothetical protein [Elusimicrobiota bacterium]